MRARLIKWYSIIMRTSEYSGHNRLSSMRSRQDIPTPSMTSREDPQGRGLCRQMHAVGHTGLLKTHAGSYRGDPDF